jgi:hypothetical protein
LISVSSDSAFSKRNLTNGLLASAFPVCMIPSRAVDRRNLSGRQLSGSG